MPSSEAADYLEDPKGYFHTKNDQEHAGQQSEPTLLVGASKAEPQTAANLGPADEYEDRDINELRGLVAERGLDVPNLAKASRKKLLEALRA